MFETLPDINVRSSKRDSYILSSCCYFEGQSNAMVDHDSDVEVHLSHSPEKIINMQNDDTLCKTIMTFIDNKKWLSSRRYFVNDKKLLHKVVGGDVISFHVLVVPQVLIEYVSHQVHNTLHHKSTART